MTPLFWGHVNPYGTINSAAPRTPRSKKVTQLGGGACRSRPGSPRPADPYRTAVHGLRLTSAWKASIAGMWKGGKCEAMRRSAREFGR